MYDIIVIGGGPAGLTAAVYARRAGKSVLILEKAALGGQITWSPKVENFPSVVSISGTDLGDRMAEQAMAQGAEVEIEEVTGIEDCGDFRRVSCEFGAHYEGRAVILATGAKPRMLGVEREEELVGSGVGYCAVCDGAFFKDLPVAVSGGGNSALQDAMLLSAITRLVGEDELTGVVVRQNGEEREIPVDGLFVAIGHEPDNGAFAAHLELNEQGYAAADEDCVTKTPWLFVAGDCRAKKVRQLTTAVADGAVAALAACSWLDK